MITPNTLIGAAGTIGTVTNTTVSAINQSVRVRRITIYAPPASQGANSTCSVEWFGAAGSNTNNLEVSDTSNSTAIPARVMTSPPRLSLASFWVAGSSTVQLASLVAPTGSIIDVILDLILCDDENGTCFQIPTATAALNTMYYLSLDGNTTHRYTPISLTTTF